MEKPELPIGLPKDIEDKKAAVRAWFENLRDTICSQFEALEDELTGPLSEQEPGRFVAKDWLREGGGGRMSVMGRPGFRESRRTYIDVSRRILTRFPRINSGRQ